MDHPLLNTPSRGGHSYDPRTSPLVTFPPVLHLESATPPLTVHLSQLVVLTDDDYQYGRTAPLPPSRLSSLSDTPVGTPVAPPGGGQSPLLSNPPVDSSTHSHPRKLHGHPVIAHPNGSYRCLSIVTGNGKGSHYTRKRESPPDVGQPCGQTFRGQDEIVRHLKSSQWHREPGEEHKLLTCDTCGKQLSRKDALTRHRKTIHLSTLFVFHRLVNKALTSHSIASTKGGTQVYNSS